MTGKSIVFALAIAVGMASLAQGAATIVIVNVNAPGIGFNDPTPAAPVGGNPGTTLGQQRLIAFQRAAEIWGARLNSTVTIFIQSQFAALSCTATAAVLGSAGPMSAHANFTGAPRTNTWYGQALANSLAGSDLHANPDIVATFNSNLGQPNCLTGTFFYLGLDNNHGANINLVTVLLHEFAHGLGFHTLTNGNTGAQLGPPFLPSIWDFFLLDTTLNTTWNAMTDAQRAASAINTGKLVWTGSNVAAAVPALLSNGMPTVQVTLPTSSAATYQAGAASFGPALTSPGVSGEVMPVIDTSGGSVGAGCTPFSPANALAVNGHIALIDRGVCGFAVKTKNAQNAGAIGVIIANNTIDSPAPGLGGADPTITIPTVSLTQADANILKAALVNRSRNRSGVFATIGIDSSVRTGADLAGRIRMWAPNPFQAGSSVSHYDVLAFPNLLMEPAINGDLTHEVAPPNDLTFSLLRDIGWNP